jgi:hypothetical protein
MSRGPVSQNALDRAMPLATLRGTVYFLEPGCESPANFEIVNGRGVTFVSARTSRCFHSSIPELEAVYHEAVCRLRAIPCSPGVYRELWICSRYGRWRFFEVREHDLVEIVIPPVGGA